ncbi:hypothetical protein [Sphingobium sp. WCS2017Hpa-17]|uniref:hypothetical protein n=1 Tax=Sphingobium sp. WCS2017Hpa-17 TaxID=3073638 RepID=UPI00288B6652|nr:hypothetical protein [Sphingobium sp. WCS2017Hpa-17]
MIAGASQRVGGWIAILPNGQDGDEYSQSVDLKTGLSYSAVNTLEIAMPSISFVCPDVDEPTQTAEATSKILATPRPTIIGWINRYSWLGIPQVIPGTTRRFSMIDLGMLAIMRQTLSARIPAEALTEVDGLPDHIRSLYLELKSKATMDGGVPHMPMPDQPVYLRVQDFMSGTVTAMQMDREAIDGARAQLMDLAGYPVPIIILPMDAAIRNAWQRMLRLRAGLSLDD